MCGLTATPLPESGRGDLIALCPGLQWEALMIIDLHSWEAGYAEGRLGRPSQCPDNLDKLSYSSGYCEGRAVRAGMFKKKAPLTLRPGGNPAAAATQSF
jgi:hypothetical protein